MPIDSDGSVVPSYLNLRSSASTWDGDRFNDSQLHYGVVQEIIPPKSPKNISKKFIEYTVLCQYIGSSKVAVTRTYEHCLLANPLSGLADKEFFTLRTDSKNPIKNKTIKGDYIGKGSKVLIACINGETINPIIISGMRDPLDQEEFDGYDLGEHYYRSVFNGVQTTINDDGEWALVYGGRTDVSGKLDGTPEDDTGSTLTIKKDGTIQFFTREKNQLMELDHSAQKLHFEAGDWVANARGGINFGAGGRVGIQSAGVTIGSGSDSFPLFSTYRRAELVKDTLVLANLTQTLALVTASYGLLSAGMALFVLPIVGTTLSTPFFAPVVDNINKMIPLLAASITAITQYEAQAPLYESLKNKND